MSRVPKKPLDKLADRLNAFESKYRYDIESTTRLAEEIKRQEEQRRLKEKEQHEQELECAEKQELWEEEVKRFGLDYNEMLSTNPENDPKGLHRLYDDVIVPSWLRNWNEKKQQQQQDTRPRSFMKKCIRNP